MDTMDSLDANLPARLPSPSSRLPAQVIANPRELTVAASSASSPVNSRLLFRGLVRNWWRILLIWLIVSLPLVFLVYVLIEPSYEAFSTLRIEPTKPELFGPSVRGGDSTGFQPYLETQRNVILTDRVLGAALGDKALANFPVLKSTDTTDPRVDLRKKLLVSIIPGTYLIRISYSSNNPKEAYEVVKAVVYAYTQQNREFTQSDTRALQFQYDKYILDKTGELETKKKELMTLAKKGNVEFPKPPSSKHKDDDDETPQRLFDKLSIDQYKRTNDQLLQTEIELMDLRALLQARMSDPQGNPDIAREDVDKHMRQRIIEEFRHDPEVTSLVNEIKQATEELEHTKSVARRDADVARVAARRHLDSLREDYNDLWSIRSEQIRQRLLVETGASGAGDNPQVLKRKIEALEVKKKSLMEMRDKYQVQEQRSSEDTLQATFLRGDIDALTGTIRTVQQKLEQLRFEDKNDLVRVSPQDEASLPKIPSINKRIRYMAILPLAMLFAVVGLFLLLEIKAERVGDPDMLSTRVQSEVFALPPLPTTRGQKKLSGPALDDQIDRFIQRLDHLRFAVCGGHHDADLGRCVLVTSAIGGEGKTTLSAQLAARCGNSGISTLLIDADLRRGALCPLLDIPEAPGLSDALQAEIDVHTLVVPVQGGTFDLLTAGTPVQDTSRVLQGRNFAMLIAQLRHHYEMIIIDSPPVLPIPDALILGRWTDGALLATRFEVSRSPQVERARRQLDQAGITVLGTVLNGMKSSDSYYGRYTYSRQRSSSPAESPRDDLSSRTRST